MQTKINGQTITYNLRRSSSLNMRISISPKGLITITVPYGIPQMMINGFIHSRADWIMHHLKQNQTTISRTPTQQQSHFIRHKPIARKIIMERLAHFNQFYGFTYHKITIRDQSSRWGSCNRNGDLSFNYRIAVLPPDLADLIIVHELCHLKEMNHSPRFWALVRKTIPNPLARRRQLDAIDMNSL